MNTTWTEYLAQAGATLDAGQVRFPGAPDEGATVAVPLTHLGLIRSRGEESAPFLHNLLSNEVNKLAEDAATLNSFNTPKGRMLASLLMWREADGHLIALSADILPGILKKLSMYILRSKVKLTDASGEFALIGVSGPKAADVLAAAGLPRPQEPMRHAAAGDGRVVRITQDSYVVAAPLADAPARFAALREAGAAAAGTDAWTLAMIRAGLPLVTAATQEAFVAQMLNFELIGGVSFHKGCYPGQEIVARTQYLGKLKKRTFRVHIEAGAAPAPATDLYAPDFGEQSAGQLVNVAPAPGGGYEALAVLQVSSHEGGEVHVGATDGPRLTFLDLPYALG
ncbi:CAF17-like 4Fe-4S cluster assembly/insertion protein YgfZ [Pseudothauera rhizosphaerae]|uniref:Folate-binding protein YgfZ n=1 Tax=Pseudothauera rhizosphaerae TaxID=2565932 RepID=A0A4S4ACT9_9RHOO|nr:folate-binding protein YgfZ [Pseudothauera rhizosphaerae]THF56518.1 folate-binding protein YgfZ [Pseudothauera rhizosphaerae]